MLKRLGGRRWTQLHRSAYAIAIIGVVHYWWLVKKDITLPLLYAVLLGALLGFRALRLARERQRQLLLWERPTGRESAPNPPRGLPSGRRGR